ncbi:hypothetical protein TNCV_2873121 [Trichonephila clavipes]|nr:hypothetical protein TNCV_2873121 [Trichonephila clavipes]
MLRCLNMMPKLINRSDWRKGRRSHGLRAESSCCCKHLRTVHADICSLANDPNDVAARSIKVMRVTSLPSLLLEIGGRLDPSRALYYHPEPTDSIFC